jgi:hypothetical protein
VQVGDGEAEASQSDSQYVHHFCEKLPDWRSPRTCCAPASGSGRTWRWPGSCSDRRRSARRRLARPVPIAVPVMRSTIPILTLFHSLAPPMLSPGERQVPHHGGFSTKNLYVHHDHVILSVCYEVGPTMGDLSLGFAARPLWSAAAVPRARNLTGQW